MLNEELECFRKHIPNEFSRKPRTVDCVKFWKATEFRLILLYTGPILLKNKLSVQQYEHFLCLSIAIRILCSKTLIGRYIEYAKSLLYYFVEKYKLIYGENNITHNVHNLLHLVEDARKFGVLDNFSSFPYENYLSTLKRYNKCSRYPLQQVVNHIYAEELHVKEILLPHSKKVYNEKENNNCCQTENGAIVIIKKTFIENNTDYCEVSVFKKRKAFFYTPCNSKTLGIYVISNLDETRKIIKKSEIACKYVKLPIIEDKFVVIPLLH